MALTAYDKKNLSYSDQKKIQAATDKWNAANASGDKDGMAAASAEAAAVRNNAGYKTDSYGNYSGSYGGSNKNSQYTGSSTAVNVNNSLQQTYKNEMNANSIAWHSADDAEKKRLEARNKELASLLGGSVTFDSVSGTWSGDAGGITQEDILDWEYGEEKPTYESKYDPQIDALLNEILNRDDFSYNAMNDPLYQQYAAMYQREGDRAMKETLAEAAAGAGGMNTYAITAAQQANSYYNSQLNDKIPELYQLAYEMYLNDKESKVQDLGLLQNMDATQYSRYRDTMSDWKDDKNFAYGLYQDAIEQGNWQTNFDNNNYWANKEFDNNNYWSEKEFDYKDYWADKDYTTNQEDKEYERNNAERESAQAEIDWLIKMGVSSITDKDLIARAGLDEATVNQMIAYYKQQNTPSGGGRIGGSGGGSDVVKKTEDDDKKVDDDDETIDDKIVVDDESSSGNYEAVVSACKELIDRGDSWGAAAYAKQALDAGLITHPDYSTILAMNNPLLDVFLKK